MTYTQALTFDIFLALHGEDNRYELADGELIDMDPTGPHEVVAGKLALYLGMAITQAQKPWILPRNCLIRPFSSAATARRPDLIILDETLLADEPRWQQEPVITLSQTVKLVAEVVSTNWENDYARKVDEYALFGIPEYWIVDYRGLGGSAFIGRPKQPVLTLCTLEAGDYQQKQYRLGELIQSPLFPNLQLCLDDLLPKSV